MGGYSAVVPNLRGKPPTTERHSRSRITATLVGRCSGLLDRGEASRAGDTGAFEAGHEYVWR